MFLHKVLFQDFRLFSQKIIEFEQQVCVIIAPNAGGKTTILEGIKLLSSGQSFRADKVEEMIAFDAQIAQVKAKIHSQLSDADEPQISSGGDESSADNGSSLGGLDELQLGVLLTRGEINGKRTKKSHYSVNDNKRRKKDFIGNLLVVAFRPEDMRLIEGSPSRRRDYLDNSLLLVDREYQSSLKQYEKTLRRRNKLLSAIQEGEQSPSTLTYWNMSLVKHGEQLQEKRREFVQYTNASVDSPLDFRLNYEPSIITQERLEQRQRSEIGAGFTLIGPHKDDFSVQINLETSTSESGYVSLDAYGSRGQKRMGVLWLKKAELSFLKYRKKELPVLLLDDILSELDEENRKRVLELVDGEQIIITTTDLDLLDEIKNHFSAVQTLKLSQD